MNRPKWKTIVGVLTIIIGLWGILNQVITIGSSSFNLAMESDEKTGHQISGEQAPHVGSTPNIIEDNQHNETTQENETSQERKTTQERESTQRDENLGNFGHTYNEHVFRTIAIGVISLLISANSINIR